MKHLMGMLRSLLVIGVVAALGTAALSPAAPTQAQARLQCSSAGFTIKEVMPNGAEWFMCWEERAREGLVLHSIAYAPPGQARRFLITQLNLAQIHVPYDDNTARFHDLSDYGLGGGNMNSMSADDCPGGALYANNGRNVLCAQIVPTHYSYKYYQSHKQSYALRLTTVSHISAYNYVIVYTFHDDGTIEPEVGATGRLQKCTSDLTYGWPLGNRTCTAGTSHAHNYYWRVDFDLGGTTNNVLEQMEFTNSAASTRPSALTTFSAERSFMVSADNFRAWRIKNTAVANADGHAISYELEPNNSHTFRGPTFEPWTANDVYLTQYRDCEKWASHNPTSGGCADNVAGFVNSQAVTDPVLWYGLSFHHLARDEDEPYMSPHWSSFRLVPRDMTATATR